MKSILFRYRFRNLLLIQPTAATMTGYQYRQRHQGKCQYQLQAVYHQREITAGKLAGDTDYAEYQSAHSHQEHKGHWYIEHPAFAARGFEEECQSNQNKCRQELIGCAKERPDIHITGKAQSISQNQSQCRGGIFIHQQFHPATGLFTFTRSNEFLQGHAANTRYGINSRHGQCRYTHGDDAGGNRSGQAKHLEETADSTGKNLEGRPLRQRTVRSRCAGDNKCYHTKQ